MIRLSMISDRFWRRIAAVATLSAAPWVAAAAQSIGVNAGATGNIVVAPNAKVTVPIIVDLSSAGALNIAGLQSTFTWGTARLTLDSLRAVTIAGWTFTPNTANAGAGSSLFAAFGTAALGATSTIANAFFTASGTTGGTRIVLSPSTAVSDVGANILNSIRTRALDVCVGTAAKWGDVNDDGVVNISDAQQVARFTVGLSVVNPTALAQRGDVTADGVVNISDAQQIARFAVGLSASPRLGTDIPLVPAATGVTVNPSAAQTLVIGASRQVLATPVNGATDLSGCAPVTWASNNIAVATVNSSGYVTAVSAGTATITATSGAFNASVTFNVSAVPVASVTVVLAPSAVQIGSTTTAVATTLDAGSNVLAGRVVTFSSSNTAVATVNAATGLVTGVAAGSATIFATSEGITGQATVTVTTGVPAASVTVALGAVTINAGATTTATATPRDAANNILVGKTITWSSSNTGVATVNAATGVVTGVSPGTANIIATVDGITGQFTVTVNAVAVASVSVALGAASISAGATTQATATTRDAANNILTGRVVSFTSNNAAVATVGAFTGIVTGVTAGTATIFATSEGVTGSVVVTVTAGGAVATVQVSLGTSSLGVGSTTQATATLRDAGNNVVTGPVTWSSSAPSIASVNSSGLVTGIAAGNATIVATSGTKTGMANLTTTIVPVATVTVTLSSTTVVVGQSVTGTAVVRDANNNILTGRAIQWAEDGRGLVSVNQATGTFTGLAPGTQDVGAFVEGRLGAVTLTVVTVPVNSVTLSLASSSISVGASTTAIPVTRDASNNILTGRTCTFTSSNTARATVANDVVTGVSAGTATITATCEGKTATATVTVVNSAVASVTVTLSQGTIGVGGTGTATATPRDAGGNALVGRVVTFASSTPSVATVNSTTGALTGVAVGNTTITATSEGISGTVTLTVGTVVTNEPSGMSLVAERPFNCVKPTACESSWYYAEDYANAATSVLSPDAPRTPNTTTSGNVVQQNFTPQLAGGTSPASMGTGITNVRVLYVQMYMKMSTNYLGHPSNVNKIIHFYTNGGNRMIFIIRGAGTGTLQPGFNTQGLAEPYTFTEGGQTITGSTEANLSPNVNNCTVVRGAWHKYEILLTNNSTGTASDGKAELWMDGVKCMDYSNIHYVTVNNKWEELNWSPTYGGGTTTITTTFFTQTDHIYASGKQ